MKNSLLLILILVGFGCQNKRNSCDFYQYFNEKDYELIATDKDTTGYEYFRLYRNKFDSTRLLAKKTWDNGKMQSAVFYTGNKKNGPFRIYNREGQIDIEGVYLNNKENGLFLYYSNGNLFEFELYFNGEQVKLDSTEKIKMIEGLINK